MDTEIKTYLADIKVNDIIGPTPTVPPRHSCEGRNPRRTPAIQP